MAGTQEPPNIALEPVQVSMTPLAVTPPPPRRVTVDHRTEPAVLAHRAPPPSGGATPSGPSPGCRWPWSWRCGSAGGGLAAVHTTGEALTSLGRVTGLVASDLLLVQVLLMARIPMVERSYGQDELARRHRWVGFTSFNLMVAHVVLITLGYAATTPAGLWGTIVDFVLNYPGMLLAVAGTVALCAVVVTSMRAARRRLRYESWHLIHLYAYLGVGLALPHQLWTGQEFLTSPLATVYWWTLYAAALGSVLVWRVGLPVYRSLRHGLVVTEVRRENERVTTVTVGGRDLHRLPVRAGQFLHWRFLERLGLLPGPPATRSPRHRTAAACGSRWRTSATAPRRCPGCGPAPGSWSRARTVGCTPACGPVARCC